MQPQTHSSEGTVEAIPEHALQRRRGWLMKNPFLSLIHFINLPKRFHIHFPGPRWALVAGYMLTIYLTLPLTPVIAKAAFKWIGKQETSLLISCVLILSLITVVTLLFRRIRRERRITALLPFLALFAIAYNMDNPIERVHLLEYGILAFLIYRAMGEPQGVTLLWTYMAAVLLGFSDESIQYLLPNRYFDLRDVAMNGVGAACGLWFAVLMHRHGPAPRTT
ncbi:MAG: VanZ family protein [Magnetococcales bacterium]|nr:VanZ family protein [Magnetococcales bacterium]